MKLIIGGAHHGKLDYALEHGTRLRGHRVASVYQCTETEWNIDFTADIINSLHKAVLAQMRNGVDPLDYMENHAGLLKSKTIICDDISCGVVPINGEMRQWREAVGRVLVQLSREADEVVRVFYGLGTKIK